MPVTELDRSRAILELTNWGAIYVVMIERVSAADQDVPAELDQLWQQLIVCDFDSMDASEQIEAILSLGVLMMDHHSLSFQRATEVWSVLEDDLNMDTSRWDRNGPSSPEDRREYRQAIHARLHQLYPELDPTIEPADNSRRLREPPDDPSGILY